MKLTAFMLLMIKKKNVDESLVSFLLLFQKLGDILLTAEFLVPSFSLVNDSEPTMEDKSCIFWNFRAGKDLRRPIVQPLHFIDENLEVLFVGGMIYHKVVK